MKKSPSQRWLKPKTKPSKLRLAVCVIALALVGGLILIISHAAPNPNLSGDLNNDNVVNSTDLSILLTDYNSSNPAADINGDGTVNASDLSILLSHWGQSVSSALTFESVTNWARPSPATQSAASTAGWRLVPFSTLTGLNSAISNMQGHDYIYYNGSGVLAVSSSTNHAFTLANKNPSLPVVIDFGTMKSIWNPAAVTPGHVKFDYTGTSSDFALYMHDDSNLNIFGGEFTGTHSGVLMYGGVHNLVWDDFVVHDVGGAGMGEQPVNGDIHDVTVRGEVYNFALTPTQDDHADKGTGIHALLIENSGTSTKNFYNNTSAIYGHDSLAPSAQWPEGGGGSVIEIGSSNTANNLNNNTLYAKGVNMNMEPGHGTNPGSTSVQTGGNALNLWGSVPDNGLSIGWAEGDHITGAVVHGASGNWNAANPQVTVLHGRANQTNLYTGGGNGGANAVPFPTAFNVVYHDIQVL